MKRRTDPLSIRIKPEIKAALQKLAEADKRTLSAYIEIILETHVEAKTKRKK